jgi:hypothetical protein
MAEGLIHLDAFSWEEVISARVVLVSCLSALQGMTWSTK